MQCLGLRERKQSAAEIDADLKSTCACRVGGAVDLDPTTLTPKKMATWFGVAIQGKDVPPMKSDEFEACDCYLLSGPGPPKSERTRRAVDTKSFRAKSVVWTG